MQGNKNNGSGIPGPGVELEHKTALIDMLREDNQLLRAIIESQRDVLIFSIDRDYTYRHFNEAFQQATYHAYGTQAMVGENMLDSITKEADLEKVKDNCEIAFAGKSHITVEEYGEINRSYFETRYNPITDGSHVTGVTVLSANITERVRAEARIKNLNKALEAFSYMAAHDLKAPLLRIDGFSSILDQEHKDSLSPDTRKLIDVITKNVREMGKLIDGILNLSRLGQAAINATQVDITPMLLEVIEEQRKLRPRERLEVVVGTLHPVACDPVLIKHVLTNLISNAIKYSSKKESAKVEIGSTAEGEIVAFYVRDNGAGFNMEYVNQLFNAFKRLHKASDFEGSGIGLAIVQKIIQNHGGKVWAEGSSGEGATFYFTLPRTGAGIPVA